ncbi:hypothetical protein [Ichthyenterobacterium magnum]|uniref:Outer membrane protein with beta-barrel domain n=1 Tax=Ichthyenterobacterium magnum TaxID=1230530 RepID=A0A420DX41_9FLAO|nr:hypothetical protein [Ichthyenterobacterium magnum]RKE98812.1 hypothetical protein BXY80_0907 [Ichthyenterobacterium magnum]
MKKLVILVLTLISINSLNAQVNETNEYVEFDDRKNVVHGVYIGFGGHYGRMDSEDTVLATFKLAYVANRQLEVGFAFTGFYNDRPNTQPNLFDGNKVLLVGGYGGFHVEPILFGDRFISISFPTLIGGGLVTYRGIDTLENENIELEDKDFDSFFIVEPGINILYNFSRYTQLETGVRYRFTSDYNLSPFKSKDNLNGYSIIVGLKIGVFNMGRKKKIKDKF